MEDLSDEFYGIIWKSSDSKVVTIPSSFFKFGNYKIGDKLRIRMEKV